MRKQTNFKLTTPVLYLAFNRLDTVKQTFPEIKKAKPKQLFIACDGPRTEEEKKKTDAVRKYILKNINWKCKVKTLFRDKNLGCKYAVSGAIDWFFENVKQGIILEDDCLPNQSFFRFCQEMLERYKNNNKVMSVSGTNFLNKYTKEMKTSYCFSRYFFCWGWATWRRAWKKMDLEMEWYKKESKKKIKSIFPINLERLLYKKRFNDNLKNITNSWAIPFFMTQIKNRGLSIIPKFNLIENKGLSKNATHSKEKKIDSIYLHKKINNIKFPLKHPVKINADQDYDKKWILRDFFRVLLKKLF